MQNLPVIATPPVTSVQASAPVDNNSAAPVTEPFGDVLARQQANAGAAEDSKKTEGKQAASTPTDSASAAGNATAAEPATVTIANAAGSLPSDMLATLIPTTTGKHGPASNEKAQPQAVAPDANTALPNDMLAMLLPGTTGANFAAGSKKDALETQPDGGKKARAHGVTADNEKTLQTADSKSALDASGTAMAQGFVNAPAISSTPEAPANPKVAGATDLAAAAKTQGALGNSKASTAPALLQAQGNTKPEAPTAGVNPSRDSAFAAVLETLGKEAPKAAQLDSSATASAIDPAAAAATDSSLPSGVASLSTSSTGPVQTAQAVINTPVTHQAWGDEFSQKVTWMATQNDQTAELHLNPPNLGPLDVVLNVSGDQATALFTSPHAAVRDVVEQAIPKLREMLADNGIMLGNAMVSDQSPKDQQAWQSGQHQKGSGGSAGRMGNTVSAIDLPASSIATLGRRHQGMVDTFA